MRIAVDLDGVCYEFQRTYRYMLNEYRNAGLDPVDDWWTQWASPSAVVDPRDDAWIWDEGVRLGLFRYGHVTRGAIVGLRTLLRAGHDLIVVSHRPANAVPDTLAWLAYINIPWDEVHLLTNQEPKSIVDADVLIDDKLQNCREWARAGRLSIVYDKPYNQGAWTYRAKDWREVVMCVQKIAMNSERQPPSSPPCLESALKMAAGSSRRETRSPGKWTTRTKRLSSRTLISGSTDS